MANDGHDEIIENIFAIIDFFGDLEAAETSCRHNIWHIVCVCVFFKAKT